MFKVVIREFNQSRNLKPNTRNLLFTIILFGLLVPILNIFMNTFILKKADSLFMNLIFNIVQYFFIPIGFSLNQILLRKMKLQRLYFFSIFLQISVILAIILVPLFNIFTLSLIALVYGLSAGIYWANRVYMISRTMEIEDGNFFMGLLGSINVMNGTFGPFIIGWIIVLLEKIVGFDLTVSYLILLVCMIFIIIWNRKYFFSLEFDKPIEIHKKPQIPNRWKIQRRITLFFGIFNGINGFLPGLLIIKYVGNEGILGTILAVSALLSSFVLINLGKTKGYSQRIKYMFYGVYIIFFVSFVWTFSVSSFQALLLNVVFAFIYPLVINSYSYFYFQTIDKVNQDKRFKNFFIIDNEYRVGWGRTIGLILFIMIYLLLGENTALTIVLLLASVMQIPMVYYIRQEFDKNKLVEIMPHITLKLPVIKPFFHYNYKFRPILIKRYRKRND